MIVNSTECDVITEKKEDAVIITLVLKNERTMKEVRNRCLNF